MGLKTLLVLLLFTVAPEVVAQCTIFTFPDLSVCKDSDCSVLISAQPRGVAHVVRDNLYGTQLGINLGPKSVIELGDNGRISFGTGGGIWAIQNEESGPFACTVFPPGLYPYSAEIAFGGWLDFTSNNRLELNPDSRLVLGSGSKIDGRLEIESTGKVSVSGSGVTMPNVNIQAENGIGLIGPGDFQIGNLTNTGTSSDNEGINITAKGRVSIGNVETTDTFSLATDGDITVNDIDATQGIAIQGKGDIRVGDLQNEGASPGNQGITMLADGAVVIGTVDGTDDLRVVAGGDITIETIENADSISLVIPPPATGVIRIGDRETAEGSVTCAATDICNNFELSGGGSTSSADCDSANADPNNCGGGAAGFGFLLLCAPLLSGRCLRSIMAHKK